MSNAWDVSVYYFPNYHVDPRNEAAHGAGWTEWELVRRAEPRWPGHYQPRVPLWGYSDESDPQVMARKIDAAADHGITTFVFDWYYYDDGPFLERALDRGFLGAANCGRLRFSLMWANHNWHDMFPAKSDMTHCPLQYPGQVTRQTWETITDRCIQRYFAHGGYQRIDGKPVFSVYELNTLVKSAGSLDATREWLDAFRAKCRRAGFPGLHLDVVHWGGAQAAADLRMDEGDLYRRLGVDAVQSYCWVHHVAPEGNLRYADVHAKVLADQTARMGRYPMPYVPNVSQGWDATPRTVQSDTFRFRGYPWIGVYEQSTPEAFRQALQDTRAAVEARPGQPRRLTINAWNEWTEGSYLEPDAQSGMAYLEAIRDVFMPG